MNKLLPIFIIFIFVNGCTMTKSTNIVKQIPAKSKCDRLADQVRAMVATKWSLRASAKTENDRKLGDWRMLGLVHGEGIQSLGYSMGETKHIAKQVHEIDIATRMDYDMLSFGYFFKAQCELKEEGKKSLELSAASKSLEMCWIPEKNPDLHESVCFKKVLSSEIVL